MNKVLELARNEKMIGSSLEAKVYLHTADAGMAAKLLEMSEAKNEADTLQRIFITSQVSTDLLLFKIHIPVIDQDK